MKIAKLYSSVDYFPSARGVARGLATGLLAITTACSTGSLPNVSDGSPTPTPGISRPQIEVVPTDALSAARRDVPDVPVLQNVNLPYARGIIGGTQPRQSFEPRPSILSDYGMPPALFPTELKTSEGNLSLVYNAVIPDQHTQFTANAMLGTLGWIAACSEDSSFIDPIRPVRGASREGLNAIQTLVNEGGTGSYASGIKCVLNNASYTFDNILATQFDSICSAAGLEREWCSNVSQAGRENSYRSMRRVGDRIEPLNATGTQLLANAAQMAKYTNSVLEVRLNSAFEYHPTAGILINNVCNAYGAEVTMDSDGSEGCTVILSGEHVVTRADVNRRITEDPTLVSALEQVARSRAKRGNPTRELSVASPQQETEGVENIHKGKETAVTKIGYKTSPILDMFE